VSDRPFFPGNKQDHNVGNRGDILKHAALVALTGLMDRQPNLRYLETHAYKPIASCDTERWNAEIRSFSGKRDYDRYADLERHHVAKGLYRCSVGLVLDVLPGARFILAERNSVTRQELLAQLHESGAEYLVLDSATDFGRISGGNPAPCLALVDPFESVHECWAQFCQGFAALRGDCDALILAFQYGRRAIEWPVGPAELMRVATIDDGPFHLAAWATPFVSADACSKLCQLGWRKSGTVDGLSTSLQLNSAAMASDSEQQQPESVSGRFSEHTIQAINLARFREVFADLHKKQKRVTYEGLGVIAHHSGLCGVQEIGRPSSFRYIELLPLEQQYLICRKDGTYSEAALVQWHDEAPDGHISFAILSRKDLELYLRPGARVDQP
jgi:hypothetical protein